MKNNTITQPYDTAFKLGLKRGSPKLIIPLINTMFHPKIPLDETASIQYFPNELYTSDGKKEKITDSQLLINNILCHIECDCYEGDKIVVKMAEYGLEAGLNHARLKIKNAAVEKPYRVSLPASGVLFLRKPSDGHLSIKITESEDQMMYHVKSLILAEYTIDKLCDQDLYILIPFYLFNHEKDIEKYNTDKACRKRVRNAMHQMVKAINKALREDKIVIFDYALLTAMMKMVTEGLIKDNEEMRKDLDEIMNEGLLRIPGDEYCSRVKDQYLSEGREEGIDEGKISVYYEDMKLSPEAIARKLNKPLEMVQKVIQKISNSNS